MAATSTADSLEVLTADYSNAEHGEAIRVLLNSYAVDPMGGGEEIDPAILATLVPELAKRPFAFSVLAFVGGEPAGLLNCFEGFSTFAAKPLVNIHDCCVAPAHRRKGISLKMLQHCEAVARARGCCKITLEVLEDNEPAKASYSKFGMQKEYAWWQKKLS